MNSNVKAFIEDYIDLIENNEFEALYEQAWAEFEHAINIGRLTTALLNAGIDPLKYLKAIPQNYYDSCDFEQTPTIPSNIKQIYDYAFYNSKIESIIIPGTVEDLFENAFDYCSCLESVILEEGVQFIGSGCFTDCGALTHVSLPKSLVEIDRQVFQRCHELTEIYYAGTMEDWDGVDRDVYTFTDSNIVAIKCSDGVIEL